MDEALRWDSFHVGMQLYVGGPQMAWLCSQRALQQLEHKRSERNPAAGKKNNNKKTQNALDQKRWPINRIINWTNVSLKRLLQATVTATSVF